MANFEKSYTITRQKWEGGYANVIGDKGGETYAGVARNFYPDNDIWQYIDFIKRTKYNKGIPRNTYFPDIEYLVKEFYLNIWDKYNLDSVKNNDVASLIFDYVVHSNGRGAKNIQKILGVKEDGIFGPITLAAINDRNAGELFLTILQQRKDFLNHLIQNDPSQEIFREGWMARIQFFAGNSPTGPIAIAVILILILLLTL